MGKVFAVGVGPGSPNYVTEIVRKTIAHVEKTVPAIAPDKSYVMFKVSVHNEEEMKKFASGNNPIAKPIFDECIEVVQMYELSKVS